MKEVWELCLPLKILGSCGTGNKQGSGRNGTCIHVPCYNPLRKTFHVSELGNVTDLFFIQATSLMGSTEVPQMVIHQPFFTEKQGIPPQGVNVTAVIITAKMHRGGMTPGCYSFWF